MTGESLNSITTLIASSLDRELDEPFKRMLAVRVDAWRSTLLSRSLTKHPEQRKFFRQTIWVPMKEEKLAECIPGCRYMISSLEVPSPVRIDDTLFDFVGDKDGTRPFKELAEGTGQYVMAGKYSSNIQYYQWINTPDKGKRIVLHEKKGIKAPIPVIRVSTVFDTPMDVFNFKCSTETDCDYWNKPYPISNDVLQMVIQYIMNIDYGRPEAAQQEQETKPIEV